MAGSSSSAARATTRAESSDKRLWSDQELADPDDGDDDRSRQTLAAGQPDGSLEACDPRSVRAVVPVQVAQARLGLEHQRTEALELQPPELVEPIAVPRHER